MAVYDNYTPGVNATGTEILGPIRQGNKDVTLTISQILAALGSLPTTCPATPGLPWLDNGVVSVSLGS